MIKIFSVFGKYRIVAVPALILLLGIVYIAYSYSSQKQQIQYLNQALSEKDQEIIASQGEIDRINYRLQQGL